MPSALFKSTIVWRVSVGKFGNCLAAGTLPVAGAGHYSLVTWPDEPSLSCAVNQTDSLFSHSPTPASIKVRGHLGCLPPVLDDSM